MKIISEKQALEKLHGIKKKFATSMRNGFEHKAKDCLTCETPGACCLDAHFVNVHISRLESVAIGKVIEEFSIDRQAEIFARIDSVIEEYGLTEDGDSFAKTYPCPLFEKGTGCLVHERGKPLPCIQHACYVNKEDLPPDEFLAAQEEMVENLNRKTYGGPTKWLPIPLYIRR